MCDRVRIISHIEMNFKQEISLKKMFGCISIMEFIFRPICIALWYTGSSDLGKYNFNPFMLNVFSHPYQFDESISNLRVVGLYFSF